MKIASGGHELSKILAVNSQQINLLSLRGEALLV